MQPPTESRSVLYEVNYEADAAIAGPFDTWLRDHVADVLQFEGFRSAEILDDDSAPPGHVRRIVQYRLDHHTALDKYLATDAPRMEAAGVARFGNQYTAEPRVLPHREEFVLGSFSTENCLNCGEVLRGQHCSHCGQHAQVRVLSMWGLVKDVVGDILDVDSRVWRTLWPLAFRPGVLTQDYLRGRRARYTPPFRMYLVLSLVFFVLASFDDPGSGVALNIDDGGTNIQLGDGGAKGEDAKSAAGADAARDTPAAVRNKDASKGTAEPGTANGSGGPKKKARPLSQQDKQVIDKIVQGVPSAKREEVRAKLEREMATTSQSEREAAAKFMEDPCGPENFKLQLGPGFKPYEGRFRDACRKIVADQQSFGRALYNNIPKMMFIFLPLIAAVVAVLYLGSGRYYVEHLLFVVHFHAFFFLAGIAMLLLQRLAGILPDTAATVPKIAEGFLGVVLIFYVPWYLLKAMRNVYGESWWKTVPKFTLLGLAYLFCLVFTGVGLLAYTALTL